ncbi:MAG: nucleoside-triphosphate diphosphatase [Streblomastix strix]|uniref:XTP/dITP diphosphatase n=1 Tax=Streblomastix strix TaxID=222440 RepID=A0A5J4W7G6_9EUKA|nr:MAG: nucleoside-triphosphate diphosphatase [Streblomastix strix]
MADVKQDLKKIFFCSGNEHKVREVTQILSGLDVEIVPININLPELQGDPQIVAQQKCIEAFKRINAPVLIDDTSLCYDAKYFLEKLGHEGLNKMLDGFESRSAYAQCIFALALNADEIKLFIGKTFGKIVRPRGSTNFGWDAIFEENISGKTYGEMNPDEKNKCSHRGKALANFLEFINSINLEKQL